MSIATVLDPIVLARDLIRCPSVTPADGGAMAGARFLGSSFPSR